MPSDHDTTSSILFDLVDMLERDRLSGSLPGLAHYLARFRGHEEEVAREYLKLLGTPPPSPPVPSPPEPNAPLAESAPPQDDSMASILRSSEASFGERLRRLAAPILRGTHFQREEEVARGGMGVIHRVRDIELDRTLAVKEMIQGPAADHALAAARFLEEAQVTAQLDHPGIVPIHEVGMNAAGHLYFAMKLVRGRDLRTILDLSREEREGWTQARILGVLLKVCEAMAYAHSKGVIHRDLKPGNVMVGHFGEVYVMDWGLARAMGRQDLHDIRLKPRDATESLRTERREEREGTPESPLVTMDGAVVGTPAYMSPEQARGEIHLLSPRCDVYSLGAMLYHLLAGQTPYVPPGARLSQHTVLVRVIEGPPRPVQELAPDVPAELVAICEKAMTRDLARRYAGVHALGEDLRAYLEGRVVKAHESGPIAELSKWVRRNKGFAAASAAAILALVVGGLTSYHQSVLAAESEMTAKYEAQRANEQALAANQRAQQVFGLSGLVKLEDLNAQADALWPLLPERESEFVAWLVGAAELERSLPEHERTLADLEGEASYEGRWWQSQLAKLVEGIRTLSDPKGGVMRGMSERGWGMEERLAFVRTMRELSIEGPEAAGKWATACDSIANRGQCPQYRGLEIEPQLGLLPIGRDPHSGLWEFAHLASGMPAQRGTNGELVVTNTTGIVLVLVPGGSFSMGAQSEDPVQPNYVAGARPDEGPVHPVELDPFFIAKYELTLSQLDRFVRRFRRESISNATAPAGLMTWNDCYLFSLRAGFEMPTEAQWEYATRAGTTSAWWTGDKEESLDGAANLADIRLNRWEQDPDLSYEKWLDDGFSASATVGCYDANDFGLHDVHGNVAEWCRDRYFSYLRGHEPGHGEVVFNDTIPLPDAHYQRVCRGGGYRGTATRSISSRRYPHWADYRDDDTGFRPARSLQR